jgi:hypothetical protein
VIGSAFIGEVVGLRCDLGLVLGLNHWFVINDADLRLSVFVSLDGCLRVKRPSPSLIPTHCFVNLCILLDVRWFTVIFQVLLLNCLLRNGLLSALISNSTPTLE